MHRQRGVIKDDQTNIYLLDWPPKKFSYANNFAFFDNLVKSPHDFSCFSRHYSKFLTSSIFFSPNDIKQLTFPYQTGGVLVV